MAKGNLSKGEGDQRPLGEGLRKKRETWPGGRAGMWPRQQLATENVGWAMCRPYAPTGAVSYDDDERETCNIIILKCE